MTRSERMKIRRRMQRRIRLVVEERRMALEMPPLVPLEPSPDPESTGEIKPVSPEPVG